MEEYLIKEILEQSGRIEFWKTVKSIPFGWDREALIAEAKSRLNTAEELLKKYKSNIFN